VLCFAYLNEAKSSKDKQFVPFGAAPMNVERL
jgi:hypothetical protein